MNQEKNDKLVLIYINGQDVVFIGKPERYHELNKEIKKFNEDHKDVVFLDFFNSELFYFGEDSKDSDLEDIIYNLLRYKFNRFEIEAKIKAEVFKSIKLGYYLQK